MNNKIILYLLVIAIFIFTGCTSNSVEPLSYEITIFLEDLPDEEILDFVGEAIRNEPVKRLEWNVSKPEHIKDFPTIVMVKNGLVEYLYSFEDLKEYFKD